MNDFHNPDVDGASSKFTSAEWSLSFSIGIQNGSLSQKDSTWEIIDRRTHERYARGDLKNFNQAATRVCTMVRNKGGKVF